MRENTYKPYMIERIVSGLTYPTTGLVGFVWLILGYITKSAPTKFTLYHCYLSIFLSLGYVLCNLLFWWVYELLTKIPYVNIAIVKLVYPFNMPILYGYSIMQIFIYGILVYLCITAFAGKYSYLPWFSNIIKQIVK